MKLKNYLADRPRGFKAEFARKIGVSKSFLRQIETGKAKTPIYLAKKIESVTNKSVKKAELRPDVWS